MTTPDHLLSVMSGEEAHAFWISLPWSYGPDRWDKLTQAEQITWSNLADKISSRAVDVCAYDTAVWARRDEVDAAEADLATALIALIEAERFLDYFANERTAFYGGGTPKSALTVVQVAIAKITGTDAARQALETEDRG